jgi:hypothetical protein
MSLTFHLRCAGAMLILLGAAHAGFGQRLNWKTDLQKLSLVNRQIFFVHCFYIALFLVMLGSVSFFMTRYLLMPGPLSRALLGGSTLLWSIRLYIQWFVFDRSLWRDNRFNRRVHYLLTTFWIYFTVVNGAAFWSVLG